LKHTLKGLTLLLGLVCLLSAVATADIIPVGYISWNVTSSTTGEFDISNETGVNSNVDFPIVTTVNLSSLSLTVDFSDSTSHVYGSSYFTLDPFDHISFDGGTIATGGANPQPIDATLTGMFSPLDITLSDSSTATILAAFSATILSSSGVGSDLNDGDFAIINATTSTSGVPEPGSWLLLGTCIAAVVLVKRRDLLSKLKMAGKGFASLALLFSFAILFASTSSAAVKLNVATSPDTGGAGQTQVNVTGSGFPAGVTAADVVVTIASGSCGGPVVATTTAMTITPILGSTERVHFLLPGSLGNATYFVSLSGAAPAFTSSNCSEVQVTHTTVATFCAPGSSLGVNAPLTGPAPVTAYVPNGAWERSVTGLKVKQIEPSGGAPTAGLAETAVATPGAVNSCGVDPTTGTAICTANDNDVYVLNGSTLTNTLTSGATTTTGFSGGSCRNCGLAINGVTHQAVITMGLLGSPSNSGYQFLDLGTLTFGPTINSFREVSEDITIDPARGFIVSPDEQGYYNLVQFTATDATTEFDQYTGVSYLDSAGEDCSTGIGLASYELGNDVFLTDFTQAVFTPGSPGTWTAPKVLVPLNVTPYAGFSAGTDGIAVAPGGSHLAAITGEFGGATIAVLQLPATSGSGTPALVDYAVAQLPGGFSSGLDPHTMTAYTSPNTGKAYGLFTNGAVTGLWVVDLEALLSAPRDPSNPHAVLVGYDLVASGIVTIIPI
jgi:hypothetical protein